MPVKSLSQDEAEEYVRCLYALWKESGPFHDVFCDESKRVMVNSETWALPDHERIYFVADRCNKVYLYGINPQPVNAINISSIGKVAAFSFHSTSSLTMDSNSVVCLRELIEKFLVPLAKNNQKKKIDAFPQGNGIGLFEALLSSHSNSQMAGISHVTWEGYICSLHLL